MSSKQKTNDPHRDLDTMSGAATDLFNRLPLTFKIMSWYTIFLLIILMVASAWIYAYTHESDNKEVRERLQQQAMIMATDIRKFKPYQDNTFFFVSTQDGYIIKGALPDGFPNQTILSLGQVGEIAAGDDTFYYYDTPVNEPNYRGILRAVTKVKTASKKTENLLYSLLLGNIIFLLISSLGGYLFIKKGLKPVRTLTKTAKVIGKNNDLSRRIDIPARTARDEIYELTTTFNRMISGLEDSSNRERQFSSDVSHELRTPIAVIKAESEFALKYGRTEADLREGLTHILEQAKFMTNLVRHMNAHEVSLRRAITNLVDNAIKFTNSTIDISAKLVGRDLVITVTDNGIGIEPEALDHIWDRMYQTEQSRNKKSNHGIGLGLYFVNKVINLHHGTVTATSEPQVKTTFTVRLPYKAYRSSFYMLVFMYLVLKQLITDN
ncbi:MAG: ATP-binding protein [Veillonella sp.]|nr:ATP-binding protein [Veillonella sp.]